MVVVDSSALIPLAWIGRLDLISKSFDDVRTAEDVREEVLTEGKRGTAKLSDFLDDAAIEETPAEAEEVAQLEGIAVGDASVILLADDGDQTLLANDKGLIEVARSHGVTCWWVTTLLLSCRKEGLVTTEESKDVLYNLVDEGMNLHPKLYAQVHDKLEEFDE